MKNIFAALLLVITFANTARLQAQAQIRDGNRISLLYPDGVTENKKFLFPTFDTPRSGYEDTTRITLNQFMTNVLVDSLETERHIYLTSGANYLPGTMVFVTVRNKIVPPAIPVTVYLYNNEAPFDTITVTDVTGQVSAIYFGLDNGLNKIGN